MDMKTDSNKLKKRNEKCNYHSTIDVNISQLVLTPLTCATLVNEIIKSLVYQKSQIPYPYNWLENIVNKKRKQTDDANNGRTVNFTVSNHFRIVSSAYDTLQNIMTNLIKEFRDNSSVVKEVTVVFGVTPQCPKEIFTIKISSLALGHVEANHTLEVGRKVQKILRNIFLSQNWVDSIDASLQCTNTYIFLKKDVDEKASVSKDDFFLPSKPLYFPPKVKQTIINLCYENSNLHSCCGNLQVFQDIIETNPSPNKKAKCVGEVVRTECVEFWCQSKVLLHGFKDCFINKISVSELW